MNHERDLTIFDEPPLAGPRLVLGFNGWMDGGDVSTGAIQYLNDQFDTLPFAEIAPEDFYVYGQTEGGEMSGLHRPMVLIEDGVLEDFEEPLAQFTYDPARNLIFFSGREPNCQWRRFSECLFQVVEQFAVEQIYFVGSVAGAVPHTRRPRFFGAVTDPEIRHQMDDLGLEPSNYEGPASFVAYMMREASLRHVPMLCIVAEIPAYVEGHNARCIQAAVSKLSMALEVDIDVQSLKRQADAFEQKLNAIMEDRDDLASVIRKMEVDYDRQAVNTNMDDLRAWFNRQGIRRN
jgi:predicted ATP-grasp superfamily ATP-dependent carboligase